MFESCLEQFFGIDLLRHPYPERIATIRPRPGDLRRELALKSVEQLATPETVDFVHSSQVCIIVTLPAEFGNGSLHQQVGVKIGVTFGQREPLYYLACCRNPGHAHARKKPFGESTHVKYSAGSVKSFDRNYRRAFEA